MTKGYGELTLRMIVARAGSALWTGNGAGVAIGDPEADHRDYAVLVCRPARAAFIDLINPPE